MAMQRGNLRGYTCKIKDLAQNEKPFHFFEKYDFQRFVCVKTPNKINSLASRKEDFSARAATIGGKAGGCVGHAGGLRLRIHTATQKWKIIGCDNMSHVHLFSHILHSFRYIYL